MQAGGAQGFTLLNWPVGHPHTACDWPITPDALYWGPRFLWERYQKPVFITENGMSAHDAVSLDGKVHDPNRLDFMHRYLLALRRAAERRRGCLRLSGNGLCWTILNGPTGTASVSGWCMWITKPRSRTPKDSALWYKTIMQTNGENL